MSFYANIPHYLNSCEVQNIPIDVRIFHFLYEHKHIMMNRIDFLLNKSIITDSSLQTDWEKIAKNALIIRNNVIKMNLIDKKTGYVSLKNLLEFLKENETVVLKKTIEHLQDCLK